MIRILLVDDHAVLREALRALLDMEPDMRVVAEAKDGASALRLAARHTPDVVIMDISMPGLDGVETTRLMRTRLPAVRVLALSSTCHAHMIQEMLDAGAAAYVLKSAAGAELRRGIRAVYADRSFLCPAASEALADGVRHQGHAPGAAGLSALSRREQQVAIRLAEGKTASAVAVELHIAPSTVEVHRRNIMRKLDVHKAADLTRYAIRSGLITP